MKKLFVSLAVLGLIGVAPAQAHKAEGVKCRATILGVTFVEGDVWQPDGWQMVETRVRIKNVSDRKLKPLINAGIYDLDDPNDPFDFFGRVGDDELPAHKLLPGESQRQHSYVNVDPGVSVDDIRVDHCHVRWFD